MSLNKITRKVIASVLVAYMLAGNILGVGIGIGQVIAEDIQVPGVTVENENQAYIPYSNETGKGIILQEKIKVGEKIAEGKEPQNVNKVDVEVNVPAINNIRPDRVSILTANTQNTTGKTVAEISSNYNKETGLLAISYNNPDGAQINKTNPKDEFEIIYIYTAEAQAENETIVQTSRKIKATIEYKIQNGTGSAQKEETIPVTLQENKGEVTSYETVRASEIYKGFMYSNVENKTNYETAYQTTEKLTIRNKDLVDATVVNLNAAQYVNSETKKDVATDTIIYKSSNINENDFNKLYGKNGRIEIYIGETKYASIEYSEAEKEEERKYQTTYYTETKPENVEAGKIVYPEGTTQIQIKTTAPQTEGVLEVKQEKAIKAGSNYGVEVSKIENLVESNKILSTKTYTVEETKKDEQGNDVKEQVQKSLTITSKDTKGTVQLKEPTKQIKAEINNKNISTLTTNKTKITLKLDDTNSSCKLHEAGEIKIKLPNNLASAKITSAEALYENGIKVTKANIQNGYVVITIEGKQTSYDLENISGGTNIVLELDIDIEDTVPTHTEKMTINYGEANIEETINIVSKYGVVVLNQLENYNSKNEVSKTTDNKTVSLKVDVNSKSRKAKQTINILNNYNEDVTGAEIIGRISADGNDRVSNFLPTLAETVKVNAKGAKVYYSENANAVSTDNTWTENGTTNSKSYKIVLENNTIKSKELITVEYSLLIPANLDYNKQSYIDTVVNYKQENLPVLSSSTFELATEKKDDSILGVDSSKQNNLSTQQIENIKISTLVTAGDNTVNEGAAVNEGQILRYTVTVENTGDTPVNKLKLKNQIENAVYYEVRSSGIVYTIDKDGKELIGTEYLKAGNDDLIRISPEINLQKGEKYTYEYQVVVNRNVENVKSIIQLINTSNNDAVISQKEIGNSVNKAKLSTELKYAYNEERLVYSNEKMNVKYIINSYDEDLKNIKAKIYLPQEVEIEQYELYGVNNEIKVESDDDGNVDLEINEMSKNSKIEITLILKTKGIDKNILNKNIKLTSKTELGRNEYYSNALIKTLNQSEVGLTMDINKNFTSDEILKENRDLVYNVKLKNNGALDLNNINITLDLDKGLTIKELYINNKKIENKNSQNSEQYIKLNSNEEANIRYTLALNIDQTDKENELSIDLNVNSGYTEQLKDNTIVKFSKIPEEEKTENPQDPKPGTPDPNPQAPKPQDPKPGTPDPNPETPEQKHSISGLAWLDSNKDGKRDEGEKLLKDITVTLINKETGTAVKDENGNNKTSTTDNNGTYRFEGLSNGEYLVMFEFDTNKYTVSTYQQEGTDSSLNSDATLSNVNINGNSKLVGVTDYLKVENSDVNNIDLGLIENAIFDLSLNKVISSVTVITPQGTKTKDYKNQNLVKTDLVARYMNDTDVIITYKFIIKNEGDVTAYVDKLVDDLPSGLEFSSDLNKDWYKGSDGDLYTTALTGIAIEPGKTSEIELVLTKKTTEETTGIFSNNAELLKISNLEAIEEKDPAKENNKSSADLLISIKTGSAMLYIGITLGSIAIIGAGAYIIKKKVLSKVI